MRDIEDTVELVDSAIEVAIENIQGDKAFSFIIRSVQRRSNEGESDARISRGDFGDDAIVHDEKQIVAEGNNERVVGESGRGEGFVEKTDVRERVSFQSIRKRNDGGPKLICFASRF